MRKWSAKQPGECTVLLKKDGSFPLDKPCSIALAGPGARETVKGGTGSGSVNSHFFTTVEQGLSSAGFTIVSGQWMDAYHRLRAVVYGVLSRMRS